MKINSLKIDGFGVWNRLELDGLSDQLSVFYGLNEAGKTTLLQFLRSMLYGFSPERSRYLPPVHGGRPGGGLVLSGSGGLYELSRYDDQRDDDEPARAIVLSPDGTRGGESTLAQLLCEIDETTFNHLFAVGLEELQELGTLSDTDAAALLFRLSAGMDRVSLVETIQALEDSRNRQFRDDGRPCQIRQLLEQRDRLHEEIDAFGSLLDQHARLVHQRSMLDRQIAESEKQKDQVQQEASLLEMAITLRDPWRRREELREQLAAMDLSEAVASDLSPERMLKRFKHIARSARKHQEQIRTLDEKRKSLRREASGLKVNRPLLREAPRIHALREQADWVERLDQRIDELHEERVETEKQLENETRQLGIESMADPVGFLARRDLSPLRRPGQVLTRRRREQSKAETEWEACRRTAAERDAEINALLADQGETELSDAIGRTGNLVAQLRRRIQLDRRLDQLRDNFKSLDRQCHDLLEGQLLPASALIGLGLVFVVGIVSALAGFFLPASIVGRLGWPLALLGLLGTATATTIKVLLERTNAAKLRACQEQLDAVSSQLRQARSESDQLDETLPESADPSPVRLEQAEERLRALEAISPLDARRQTARRELETAEAHYTETTEAFEAAQKRWADSNRAAGLPEHLSVKQVQQLSERADHLVQLARRVDRCREEETQRQDERDGLVQRIRRLAEETGMRAEADHPADMLRELLEALAHHESLDKKRRGLREEDKKFHRRRTKHEKRIRVWKRRRRSLLEELGIRHESQLEQQAQREAEAKTLREELNQVQTTIATAIGPKVSEDRLAVYLETSDEQIEQQWDESENQVKALEEKLKQMLQEQGEIAAQVKSLASDRRPSQKRLELASVEKRLDEAIRQWQVQTMTTELLTRIKKLYEKTRQPETLQDASDYLKRMTLGHYVRVWTPLGEDLLYVDDNEGNTLTVESLSRGTREQLFLALRMALVGSYARRGVQLPLILDDVLVNYDSRRAQAAAEVLHDFAAEGHQMFVFTCHDHIYQIFRSLDVTVKKLTRRDQTESATEVDEAKSKKKEVVDRQTADEQWSEDQQPPWEEEDDDDYETEAA